jgi:hypothetical protein
VERGPCRLPHTARCEIFLQSSMPAIWRSTLVEQHHCPRRMWIRDISGKAPQIAMGPMSILCCSNPRGSSWRWGVLKLQPHGCVRTAPLPAISTDSTLLVHLSGLMSPSGTSVNGRLPVPGAPVCLSEHACQPKIYKIRRCPNLPPHEREQSSTAKQESHGWDAQLCSDAIQRMYLADWRAQ